MPACIALTNACGFTSQAAQVIEFCSSHATSLNHVDMVDDGCVKRKDSLNADTKAGFADRNCFPGAAMFASDDHTFKSLQTLLGFRFLDTNVNAHRIARLKIRNVSAQLGVFNTI